MTTSIYTAQGRMTPWPATSTPNIWKTDLAMSRLSPSKNAAKRSLLNLWVSRLDSTH
jgi:hypothetical protein